MTNNPKLSPLLRWAGGKRWLTPALKMLWDEASDDRCFVEPMCGGLSVSLGLEPLSAIINDVNPHLINFYRQIQMGFDPRMKMLNDEAFYYAQRTRFNALIAKTGGATGARSAALFYYLLTSCFNGLCRFNLSGQFNTPFGRIKSPNYHKPFAEHQLKIKPWIFTNVDFEDMYIGDHCFIYCDPPYHKTFTSYSKGGFGWEDQVRLANWASRHDGPTIISNNATPEILTLYRSLGFTIAEVKAPRRISCNGDRTPCAEILAVKNIAPALLKKSIALLTKKTDKAA